MLIVLRLRTGYGTISPTKAGRNWSVKQLVIVLTAEPFYLSTKDAAI